jgi:hypothetical protein
VIKMYIVMSEFEINRVFLTLSQAEEWKTKLELRNPTWSYDIIEEEVYDVCLTT